MAGARCRAHFCPRSFSRGHAFSGPLSQPLFARFWFKKASKTTPIWSPGGHRNETKKAPESRQQKGPKRAPKWTPKWHPKWLMDHPRRPPEAVRGPTLERLVARAASRGGLGAPRGSVSTPPGQTYPFLVLKGPFGGPKSGKIQKK